mmetsp:Transcript_27666/g.36935  ORF Transcript_27666/g.36935 Transcript_27666/m.36935 type:complete len:83 (+) Transcript_27666:305-553(+)
MQKKYKVELANNSDFEDFSLEDWEESFLYKRDPNFPKPRWSPGLKVQYSENLRTEKQMDSAIQALVEWRAQYGLEEVESIEF